MAPIQHMVSGSDQDEDVCQSYSYYFGLDLGPYYHECSTDFECSEPMLIVDCSYVVDTGTEVVDTERRKHKDTDNMAWVS